MTMKSKKILFYSPYGLFIPHIMREMILIQRLLRDGHEVTNIACDKTFNICDYKSECSKCFNISKGHVADANFATKWLGQYVTKDDHRQAESWLTKIEPKDYPEAMHGNLKLGDWVRSSVHFMLKISKLEYTNPLILKTYQQFLKEGFIFSRAVERLLGENSYDKIMMTNGRFFSHRIFLEMAKLRNIPIITKEYGHYYQTMQMQFGLMSNSYNNLSEKWYKFNRTPLNLQSLLHVHQIILDKRFRRRSPYGFFTPLPNKTGKTKSDKKMVLCALSSEYEFNASPDHPHIVGTQVDWMKLLIPEMSKYPNHHFIIKLHPNSEESIVTNMRELFSTVNLNNCEVLWPNTPKSTYDLIDEADYIMVFWSTVGMEAACAGKKVFCITHCTYYGAPFLKSLRSAETHNEDLKDFLMDLSPISNIREEAYRFCYRYFIEQSIPFTPTSNPKGAVTIYNQPIEFYRNTDHLPHDPYLDYLVECIENEKFPDTAKINGIYQDRDGIQEKFFFKSMSLIQDFGDISFPKRKILILRKKKQPTKNHCFENAARLDLFHDSTILDWVAFHLLQDGHQVYTIDPENKDMLDQWAHEYGLASGSHNLNKILNSPIIFKIVSEILFKSPWLMSTGRKFLFWIGKFQKKSSTKSTLKQFIDWFQPDFTISESQTKFEATLGDFSFNNSNIDHLMADANFEDSMQNVFKAVKNLLK